MQILEKIKRSIKNSLTQGCSVEKLTLSVCMGIYIAFSPFPGVHTIMMFIVKGLFNINFPVLFISTSINNPWTMIPFYTFDYIFGHWLIHNILGFNPGWSIPIAKIFGSGSICVWSFFIGGNILGISVALLSYPFVKIFFVKLVTKFKTVKQS